MTDIPNELTEEEILQKAEELKKARELVTAEEERIATEVKRDGDANKEGPANKSYDGLKIFGIILIFLIILAGIIIISADVNITGASDKSYAYDTTYNVWIPLDKELNLGGYKIIALSPSSGGTMMISLGGETYPLVVNEVTYVPDQIGTLTILWGGITVMQIQYEVDLTYLGNTNNKEAAFRMVISSNQQLPEFLLSLFLSKSGVIVSAI